MRAWEMNKIDINWIHWKHSCPMETCENWILMRRYAARVELEGIPFTSCHAHGSTSDGCGGGSTVLISVDCSRSSVRRVAKWIIVDPVKDFIDEDTLFHMTVSCDLLRWILICRGPTSTDWIHLEFEKSVAANSIQNLLSAKAWSSRAVIASEVVISFLCGVCKSKRQVLCIFFEFVFPAWLNQNHIPNISSKLHVSTTCLRIFKDSFNMVFGRLWNFRHVSFFFDVVLGGHWRNQTPEKLRPVPMVSVMSHRGISLNGTLAKPARLWSCEWRGLNVLKQRSKNQCSVDSVDLWKKTKLSI